jgi:hypothetical protein
MRDQYDFKGGMRGKYAERFAEGTNLVLLEPDVAKEFPDSRSVNEALREVIARRAAGESDAHRQN